MHERSLKKHIPDNAVSYLYKEALGRQYFVLSFNYPEFPRTEKIWAKKLTKTLTKNGCHVTVEDSYATARNKVERALRFHRLEIETEDECLIRQD